MIVYLSILIYNRKMTKPSLSTAEGKATTIANLFAGYGVAGVIAFYFIFHFLPNMETNYKNQIAQMTHDCTKMMDSQAALIAEYKKIAEEGCKSLQKTLELINRKVDTLRPKPTKNQWPSIHDQDLSAPQKQNKLSYKQA